MRIATNAIRSFLDENDINVILVVFDKEALSASEELLYEVTRYIDKHNADELTPPRHILFEDEEQAFELKKIRKGIY